MPKSKSETRGGIREGAGRKPLPPELHTVTVNITLPPHLLAYLDSVALAAGASRSAFIALLLVDAKRADERRAKQAER